MSSESTPPGAPLPRATYRLQFTPEFGFDDAAALADYFAALGISHVYLSPILEASPGSTHGYDVVNPERLSLALGGEAGYERLACALTERGLAQLLDIVPNHMAIGPQNPWWWDVLENGPSSYYADYFDIDWSVPEERLRDKVLLPILGDHSGRVVEAGRSGWCATEPTSRSDTTSTSFRSRRVRWPKSCRDRPRVLPTRSSRSSPILTPRCRCPRRARKKTRIGATAIDRY